jgi:hypothetical protein
MVNHISRAGTRTPPGRRAWLLAFEGILGCCAALNPVFEIPARGPRGGPVGAKWVGRVIRPILAEMAANVSIT